MKVHIGRGSHHDQIAQTSYPVYREVYPTHWRHWYLIDTKLAHLVSLMGRWALERHIPNRNGSSESLSLIALPHVSLRRGNLGVIGLGVGAIVIPYSTYDSFFCPNLQGEQPCTAFILFKE